MTSGACAAGHRETHRGLTTAAGMPAAGLPSASRLTGALHILSSLTFECGDFSVDYRLSPILAASLCIAASLLPARAAQAQSDSSPKETMPNVVFFLADNTGWGDWGVYGGQVATPNIDQLAAEGMRFTNYNVEVQCTPSRSAIMTGRHPVRSGTYNVLPPKNGGPVGLNPWEYTIGELFSDAGYKTALYGKWHLGNIQGRLPNDQGFDEWWGIPNSWDESGYTQYPLYNAMIEEIFKERGVKEALDAPPHVLEGKKGEKSKIAMELDMELRPVIDGEYLVPKTVDYIKTQAAAGEPFFVYLGYSEMHPPVQCNPEFVGKSLKHSGMYADCIAEMDHRVGQVMEAVKEAGVEDNTIFVLSSDNATGGLSAMRGPTAAPTDRSAATSSILPMKAACGCPRLCAGPARSRQARSPTRSSRPWTGCRRWRRRPAMRIWCRQTGRWTASISPSCSWARATARGANITRSSVSMAR